MAKKNGLIAAFDNLPWLVKLLFCIPCLDIIWAVYRIVKGVTEGNALLLIVGILWIIPGAAFLWIVDIITVLLFKHPILA